MAAKVTCKATWGHIAGYGFSGRGYAVYRDGVQVTSVCGNPAAAWAAYHRDKAAAQSETKREAEAK